MVNYVENCHHFLITKFGIWSPLGSQGQVQKFKSSYFWYSSAVWWDFFVEFSRYFPISWTIIPFENKSIISLITSSSPNLVKSQKPKIIIIIIFFWFGKKLNYTYYYGVKPSKNWNYPFKMDEILKIFKKYSLQFYFGKQDKLFILSVLNNYSKEMKFKKKCFNLLQSWFCICQLRPTTKAVHLITFLFLLLPNFQKWM